MEKEAVDKYERIGQESQQIHQDKDQVQPHYLFLLGGSRNEAHHCIVWMIYFPFLFFPFDPAVDFVPPRLRVASLFLISDCMAETWPGPVADEPPTSALEAGLVCLGLRLLTPLRPMISPFPGQRTTGSVRSRPGIS
jgi:hypothetical protein